jgi:hypothetical protein
MMLDGLRERVRQLEEMQPRMAELEERVDFTERVPRVASLTGSINRRAEA